MPEHEDRESGVVRRDMVEMEAGRRVNGPTFLACPDCGGVLWEFGNGDFKHFQCHVGHKFSPASLPAQHAEVLEHTLWAAVRTLEERASIVREMANVARQNGGAEDVAGLMEEAAEAERNAEVIRRMLLAPQPQGGEEAGGEGEMRV